MNAFKHLATITHHKNMVRSGCFKIGLYKQGLLHDLSKYSPTEFIVGCKYYKGYMSPNNAEREDKGYSSAWLHHKGRNKHHLEYWIDYTVGETDNGHDGMGGMKMPIKYVCEMFIDRISASKNYQKDKYTNESPYKYYLKGKHHYMMHKDTQALLQYMLVMLAVKGEKETFPYVKNEILKNKVPYEKNKLEALELKLREESDYFVGWE